MKLIAQVVAALLIAFSLIYAGSVIAADWWFVHLARIGAERQMAQPASAPATPATK